MKEKHKRETIFWQTFCYNGAKRKKGQFGLCVLANVVGGWMREQCAEKKFECSIALENFTPTKHGFVSVAFSVLP